jgi:hypothetical protein
MFYKDAINFSIFFTINQMTINNQIIHIFSGMNL